MHHVLHKKKNWICKCKKIRRCEKKSVTINRPIGDLDVVINRHGFLNHYDKRVKEFTGEN